MAKSNRSLRRAVAGLAVVLALGVAMPAVAGAQGINGQSGPTSDQYDPPVVKVNTSAGGSDEGSALTDPVGPLPFTGFDVIAMLAVALGVTGLGLALQRAVTKQPRELD
jgi:F0F1-type ATP synthase membrane subunit c/vacuolar-type H+-ATPase subunit K